MKKGILIIVVVAVVAIAAVYFLARPGVAPELADTTNTINTTDTTDTTNTNTPDEASPDERNVNMFTQDEEAEVTASEVVYSGNVKGYLAKPTASGTYPGVVMIHEWWGLNDNIKTMARVLASQGYAVLAVDLYNGKVAADATEARTLVSSLDQAAALNNLRAAANYLRTTEHASRLATLGWCFGGGQSMQFALSGEAVDATVIYYGNLVIDQAKLALIDWPVLGVFGETDQSISVESVNQFDAALDTLGVDNEIYVYAGVGHAFANPSGASYAPQETKDAWDKTLAFLEKHLR